MKRVLRVNQLIKKELAQIILRQISFPRDILVTLTRVDTSPNLIQAKVYISVIPEEKLPGAMAVLARSIFELQQSLNRRLRMRPMPKIIFVEEKATKEAGRIEELLTEIQKQK